MALDIAGLSGLSSFRFMIPPELLPLLPLGISRLPIEAPIGGRMVAVRETVRAMLADGDLDFADVLAAFAAVAAGAPIPPAVIVLPPERPDDEPAPGRLVWPDAVSIKVNWAQEPGTDNEGQQVLVPVEASEGRDGVVVVGGGSHPGVVNDRTKFTFEAGLSHQGRGLHFADHPHLVGAIEWIAEDIEGNILGSIGGSGSVVDVPRAENGIGWGGARYVQSGGTLGVASIKPQLKGSSGIRFYARVPNAPGTPRSRTMSSELVV